MKRETIQIKALILEAAKTPKNLTTILAEIKYLGGAYSKFFKYLFERGLLEKHGKKYKTTRKGLGWLKTYEHLKTLEQHGDA